MPFPTMSRTSGTANVFAVTEVLPSSNVVTPLEALPLVSSRMTEIVEETKINTTLSDTKKTILEEKISLNVNRLLVNPSLYGRCPDFASEFQRPDEA